MKSVNERVQAVRVLTKLVKNNLALSQGFQAEAEVSPFAKAICFGVCRHYYRLEAIANLLMSKPQKSVEVKVVLWVGLYQLLYLEKPPYAVVKETVEVLSRLQLGWAKGFVNAILRTFCREQETLLAKLANTGHEEYLYGHPAWLLALIKADWPAQWLDIVAANDAHPPMSLRVNLSKISREAYVAKLQAVG